MAPAADLWDTFHILKLQNKKALKGWNLTFESLKSNKRKGSERLKQSLETCMMFCQVSDSPLFSECIGLFSRFETF